MPEHERAAQCHPDLRRRSLCRLDRLELTTCIVEPPDECVASGLGSRLENVRRSVVPHGEVRNRAGDRERYAGRLPRALAPPEESTMRLIQDGYRPVRVDVEGRRADCAELTPLLEADLCRAVSPCGHRKPHASATGVAERVAAECDVDRVLERAGRMRRVGAAGRDGDPLTEIGCFELRVVLEAAGLRGKRVRNASGELPTAARRTPRAQRKTLERAVVRRCGRRLRRGRRNQLRLPRRLRRHSARRTRARHARPVS